MLRAMRPVPKPVRALKTKKRKKVNSRTMLERRADTLVREIVLDRDGYCVCPAPKKGHTDILQCGHIITRGKESVKWDLYNTNAQCSGCNGRHRHYSEIYINWFVQEFDKFHLDRLVQDSYVVTKLKEYELEILISELTSIHRRQLDRPDWKPYFTQKQILDGSWRNYDRIVRTPLP